MQQQKVKFGKPDSEAKEGFDLQTHYIDPATKRVSHINPYRMHAVKGVQYFERPVGSLNLFYKDGTPAGRLDAEAWEKNKIEVLVGAKHEEWVAPRTQEELKEQQFEATVARNKQLEQELAQLRAEKEKKDGIANKNTRSSESGLSGDSSANK